MEKQFGIGCSGAGCSTKPFGCAIVFVMLPLWTEKHTEWNFIFTVSELVRLSFRNNNIWMALAQRFAYHSPTTKRLT